MKEPCKRGLHMFIDGSLLCACGYYKLVKGIPKRVYKPRKKRK